MVDDEEEVAAPAHSAASTSTSQNLGEGIRLAYERPAPAQVDADEESAPLDEGLSLDDLMAQMKAL